MPPIDLDDITMWFIEHQKPNGAIDVRTHILDDSKHALLERFFVSKIPECYIPANTLATRVDETGLSASEILQNKLPDPGSVMAGDFGEILTLFYLGSALNGSLEKIKKWQFKQDRTKPAPHSDVIILHRKDPNIASKDDFVICAEAKVKSTQSTFCPIEKSIDGYNADKTGRLARTLVWLKEKAIDQGSSESINYIRRFTDAHLNTGFKKNYKAVAIIDRKFLDQELQKSLELPEQSEEFEIIVIGITDLKLFYERTFFNALKGVSYD